MDRIALLEALKALTDDHLDEVLYRARLSEWTTGSRAERARVAAQAAEADAAIHANVLAAIVAVRGQHPAESLQAWTASRARHFGKLRLLGVREPLSLDFDAAYIPLQLDPRADGLALAASRSTNTKRTLSLAQALALLARPQLAGLALIGNPGAGKTTLLHRAFCDTIKAAGTVPGLERRLQPVFISLKDFDEAHLHPRGLRAAIEGQAAHDGYPGAAAALFVEPQPLLVLLDGLDEVASEDKRVAICQWLEHEVDEWGPETRYMLTCRQAAWLREPAAGRPEQRRLSRRFLSLDVQALDPPAIESFVRAWYAAAAGQLYAAFPVEEGQQEAEGKAERLLVILRDPQRLRNHRLGELMSNPLLLATLCLVYAGRDDLPERRAELLDWCLTLLIELRTNHRDPQLRRLRSAPVREVLQPIAWAMQAGGDSAWPRAAIEQRAGALLPETPLADLKAERFVTLAHEHCGMFAVPDPGQLAFFHPSFREYLAASHAVQNGLFADLATHVGEVWWREVILLAVAQPGALHKFVEALVDGPGLLRGKHVLREALAENPPRISPTPFVRALQGMTQDEGALPLLDTVVSLLAQPWLPAALHDVLAGVAEAHPAAAVRAAAQSALRLVRVESRDVALIGRADRAASVPIPVPGELWQEPNTGLTFVWIPAGTFLMGSSKTPGEANYDADAHDNELPTSRVRFTFGFWMGQHPVTNEVYARFLAATKRPEPEYWRNTRFNKAGQPVTGVDVEDALAFCRWATTTAGRVTAESIGLPSEAQWEYVARAAGRPDGAEAWRYPWGNDAPSAERAVFGNSGGGPAAVGGRPAGATPLGVHDLAGNVWEWCLDAYASYPTLEPGTVRQDPPPAPSPDGAAPRVVRGGSWGRPSRDLRAALRLRLGPGLRHDVLGFRVVCRGSRQHA